MCTDRICLDMQSMREEESGRGEQVVAIRDMGRSYMGLRAQRWLGCSNVVGVVVLIAVSSLLGLGPQSTPTDMSCTTGAASVHTPCG